MKPLEAPESTDLLGDLLTRNAARRAQIREAREALDQLDAQAEQDARLLSELAEQLQLRHDAAAVTDGQQLLTTAQTTAMLRISRATLYRKVDAGELTPVKIGSAVRFRRSDVDAYVTSLSAKVA